MAATQPGRIRIQIEKRAIRKLFYLGALSFIIILAIALSTLYTQSLSTEFDNKIHQLSESLIKEKKRYLRNAVERTIYTIEFARNYVRNEYGRKDLTEADLDAMARERIKNLVRQIRLIDDGYIWINRIENYDGGDNYATRIVHPNLPETEGQSLSTHTTDISGEKPYLEELEGVKANGELFFEYYFKKLNSDKVAHKMSYAKLYKPWDWVVATGVYLDDLDMLVADETARMHETYKTHLILTYSISALCVFLATIAIVIFDRSISRTIREYEGTIDRHVESLETLSTTDMLTGLANRFKLDEVFTYQVSQAKRYDEVFAVLLLDLDNFKVVNDTHGHGVGDEVLKATADILRNNTRDADTAGRWGGEEFLVILPKTDLGNAMLLADKIRQIHAEYEHPVAGVVTCSIGVSAFDHQDCKETLIESADKALYCAKHKGRNQVRSAECDQADLKF